MDFNVQAVTEGLDSIGTVTVRVEKDGKIYTGRGAATDIIVASAKAYLSAVNRFLAADEASNLPAVGTTP
jgi:2-isopropylmalate synthase